MTTIPFPKERIYRAQPSEMTEMREKLHKKVFIDEIVAEESVDLSTKLAFAGFDMQDPKIRMNMVLISELLRASLYSSNDIQHPFTPALNSLTDIVTEIIDK